MGVVACKLGVAMGVVGTELGTGVATGVVGTEVGRGVVVWAELQEVVRM